MQYFQNPLSIKANRLVFNHETPESTPKSVAERRAESTKEIIDDAKKTRQAIQGAEITDTTIETDEKNKHLLKEDTSILISQKGSGSKHNEAGWKGLALTTDDVTILDYNIHKINGKEYVKVKLNHKLGGVKNKYRTYVGYIEKEAFKDSPEVQRLKAMKEGYEKAQVEIAKETEIKGKLQKITDRFSKLFAKYPIEGSSTGITYGEGLNGIYRINYGSSNFETSKNIVTVEIDTSKDPFSYKVNGVKKYNQDGAYLGAAYILKQEAKEKKAN